MSQEWWQTFFGGIAVDFWLQATTVEQTRQEVDATLALLQVHPPAKILDAPCGGGRHSLAMAELGYQMTGLDISPDFLTAARRESATRYLKVDWRQADMRTLPWQNEFDGAFCLGNSFGYCRDEGNLAFLQAIARSLRSGGRFVLDTSYVAETLLPILREREWYPVGDMLVLSDRRYDPEDSRLHVEYTFIRDGQSHKQAMSARIHSYREIRQLLQQAGFAEVVGFGGLAKEPFRLGAKRLLMTAMKR